MKEISEGVRREGVRREGKEQRSSEERSEVFMVLFIWILISNSIAFLPGVQKKHNNLRRREGKE